MGRDEYEKKLKRPEDEEARNPWVIVSSDRSMRGIEIFEVRRLTQSRDVCAPRKMIRNVRAKVRPDRFQHLICVRLAWVYFPFAEYRSRTCPTHWYPLHRSEKIAIRGVGNAYR